MILNSILFEKSCIFANRFKKYKNMVITINKNTRHQEIEKMLLRLKPRKLFHSKTFLGKIKWGEDGLEYQKRIRDEWN